MAEDRRIGPPYSQDLAGLAQAIDDVKAHSTAGGATYWLTNDGRVRKAVDGQPDTFHDLADIQDELDKDPFGLVSPGSVAQGLEKLGVEEPTDG